jgi:hypothetical protein
MAGTQAVMDYDQVENIAGKFDAASETTQKIITTLNALVAVLTTACVVTDGMDKTGMVWMEVSANPVLQTLKNTCSEMAGDLRAVIRDHQQADQDAASAF